MSRDLQRRAPESWVSRGRLRPCTAGASGAHRGARTRPEDSLSCGERLPGARVRGGRLRLRRETPSFAVDQPQTPQLNTRRLGLNRVSQILTPRSRPPAPRLCPRAGVAAGARARRARPGGRAVRTREGAWAWGQPRPAADKSPRSQSQGVWHFVTAALGDPQRHKP